MGQGINVLGDRVYKHAEMQIPHAEIGTRRNRDTPKCDKMRRRLIAEAGDRLIAETGDAGELPEAAETGELPEANCRRIAGELPENCRRRKPQANCRRIAGGCGGRRIAGEMQNKQGEKYSHLEKYDIGANA